MDATSAGSVWNMLSRVERRPSMYVGWDDAHRIEQLRTLEAILVGYQYALIEHGIQEPVGDFLAALADYLRRTRGWSMSAGPVAAVMETERDPARAWATFWEVVRDFRGSLEPEQR